MEGYVAVPRSIPFPELARSADIAPNSTTARIRRDISNLMRSTEDFENSRR